MTIGALVGHLLHSGILLLEESLDHAIPTNTPMTTAEVFALIPLDRDDVVHGDVRDVAENESANGPAEILDRATTSRDRLADRLVQEPVDRTITIAFGDYGVPMTLDEFVTARVLELVVHLDDLVVSMGTTDLPVSPSALALTCHVGLDISIRRHGSESVLRALFRRDRNSLDALRPL